MNAWKPRVLPGGRRHETDAGREAREGRDDPGRGRSEASSDAELVRLTLEGRDLEGRLPEALPGEEPFGVLVARHETRVLRLARRLCARPEDARDVAQDAFLRAFRFLGSYRPDRPFTSWLLKIVVNAARDHRERERRAPEAVADLVEPEAPGEGADAADRAVLMGQVRRAVLRLHPREREVFVLRELEGLDVDDIAALLELAPPTVRRHLARARLALRRILREGSGGTPPDGGTGAASDAK